MLRGWREIGVAVRSESDLTGTAPTATENTQTVQDYAVPTGSTPQMFSTTDVQTYPCQGVTGTYTTLRGEFPNVIATRDYAKNPTGQPIVIMVREGQILTITSASVTETATGVAVPLQPTLTSATDAQHMVSTSEAIVIPDVPLKQGTSYTVEIKGDNSGQSFIRNFTFSTTSLGGGI